jgi:hypothetical protein
MFVPCINSIKALLLFHKDAHNHKITGILKQLKILTVAPTCFGSCRNHHQGVIFVLSSTVYRTPAQQAGMLP